MSEKTFIAAVEETFLNSIKPLSLEFCKEIIDYGKNLNELKNLGEIIEVCTELKKIAYCFFCEDYILLDKNLANEMAEYIVILALNQFIEDHRQRQRPNVKSRRKCSDSWIILRSSLFNTIDAFNSIQEGMNPHPDQNYHCKTKKQKFTDDRIRQIRQFKIDEQAMVKHVITFLLGTNLSKDPSYQLIARSSLFYHIDYEWHLLKLNEILSGKRIKKIDYFINYCKKIRLKIIKSTIIKDTNKQTNKLKNDRGLATRFRNFVNVINNKKPIRIADRPASEYKDLIQKLFYFGAKDHYICLTGNEDQFLTEEINRALSQYETQEEKWGFMQHIVHCYEDFIKLLQTVQCSSLVPYIFVFNLSTMPAYKRDDDMPNSSMSITRDNKNRALHSSKNLTSIENQPKKKIVLVADNEIVAEMVLNDSKFINFHLDERTNWLEVIYRNGYETPELLTTIFVGDLKPTSLWQQLWQHAEVYTDQINDHHNYEMKIRYNIFYNTYSIRFKSQDLHELKRIQPILNYIKQPSIILGLAVLLLCATLYWLFYINKKDLSAHQPQNMQLQNSPKPTPNNEYVKSPESTPKAMPDNNSTPDTHLPEPDRTVVLPKPSTEHNLIAQNDPPDIIVKFSPEADSTGRGNNSTSDQIQTLIVPLKAKTIQFKLIAEKAFPYNKYYAQIDDVDHDKENIFNNSALKPHLHNDKIIFYLTVPANQFSDSTYLLQLRKMEGPDRELVESYKFIITRK